MCVYICIIVCVYTGVCMCWPETPDCSVKITEQRLFPLTVCGWVTAVQLKRRKRGTLMSFCPTWSLSHWERGEVEQSETGQWLSRTAWRDHGRLNGDDVRCSQHIGLVTHSWGGVIRYLRQPCFGVLQHYRVAQSDSHIFISFSLDRKK